MSRDIVWMLADEPGGEAHVVPSPAIPISEIFGPTIQGEGAHIGSPTVFVRTGGCDFRCSWCDSMYAVDPHQLPTWTRLPPVRIMDRVRHLSGERPLLITLSGGNPALHHLGDLLTLGQAMGYTFTLETQGSINRAWMAGLDSMTVSPKPPSSGMPTRYERLSACLSMLPPERLALKFVVLNDEDYQYARAVAARYPHVRQVFLQPCNLRRAEGDSDVLPHELASLDWLVAKTLGDHWYEARVLPQLHVLLWGNRRGV